VIVSRATNGVNETLYSTTDHLGSSSAVTNSAGAVLMQSSFGAYGARRSSNWQGTPSSGEWSTIASTTRCGFTAHTMLDNLSLIHMNGRVMDPLLGRFVSADPNIDGVMDTQGWNRYSYVKNGPLSATDPSGFNAERRRARRDGGGGGLDDLEIALARGMLLGGNSAGLSEGMEGSRGSDSIVANQQAAQVARLVSTLNNMAARSDGNRIAIGQALAQAGHTRADARALGLTTMPVPRSDGPAAATGSERVSGAPGSQRSSTSTQGGAGRGTASVGSSALEEVVVTGSSVVSPSASDWNSALRPIFLRNQTFGAAVILRDLVQAHAYSAAGALESVAHVAAELSQTTDEFVNTIGDVLAGVNTNRESWSDTVGALVGGFGNSGFAPEYQFENDNQVRHFVGIFVMGYSYGNYALAITLAQARELGLGGSYRADRALNPAAVRTGVGFRSGRIGLESIPAVIGTAVRNGP
jgi:RHS repeat-associated protein